jgi:hypothetical protein
MSVFDTIIHEAKNHGCSINLLDEPTEQYSYSCYDSPKIILIKSYDSRMAKIYHNNQYNQYRDYVLLHEFSHHLTRLDYTGIDVEFLAEKKTREIALRNQWQHIISIQNEVIDHILKIYNQHTDDKYGKYYMARKMREK